MKEPITLKTLPQATAQEVFDQVASHLLKQGRQSLVGQSCRYRGDDGLKCAAGCLIADGEYKTDFETITWDNLAASGLVPLTHSDLIYRLQLVHDCSMPMFWHSRLQKVAERFNLTFNP